MPMRCSQPASPRPFHSSSVQKVTCTEDSPSDSQACSSALAMVATGTPLPGRRNSRGPGTGLNGTATCSFG